MQLDKASYYALLATVCIAQYADEKPVQGRTVADLCGLPVEYALKILQQLARNGILISERGRGGGFQLGRPPEEIAVLDIVEEIQGPIRGQTGGQRQGRLPRPERIIEDLCDEIADHARQRLSNLTIADLMVVP